MEPNPDTFRIIPKDVAFFMRGKKEDKPKMVINDPRFRIRPLQQVASACTGGLLTALFMTPLDVVKTRLQAQQTTAPTSKCSLYCNRLMDHLFPTQSGTSSGAAKPPIRLNGTMDAFFKISRTEGLASLWSGLSPTFITAIPSTVIYFVSYEQIKTRLVDFNYTYLAPKPNTSHDREVPFFVPLTSGMSARICAVSFVSPIELIRTKMQSQRMTYAQIYSAVRNVINSQGFLGLWRGLPPTILRDVPFSGIYWTCYESIKEYCNVVEPTFGFSFIAGAISGSTAATITTPFDVIKTHAQIEFGEKVVFAVKPLKVMPPTPSVHERLATLYRTSGFGGVFAGLGPRLLKIAPACAIMIATFEHSKSFFYHYNIRQYEAEQLAMKTKKL